MKANRQGCEREPNILIVDDSLTVRMDLCETLQSAGFSNRQCDTLAAARVALAEQSFSLVILDVLLPDGDGLDLLRQIRSAKGPTIPVLLLSSEAEVRDRVRGLKTGADDYIGKPYDRGHILSRVRQLIGGVEQTADDTPRILLIDNNAIFREAFQRVLEAAGYAVVSAESGESGLNMAFTLQPDAILVDRVLAGGIGGHTVIRRLRQDVTLRNTPCLLLTGSAETGEELQVLEAGADAYLTKETDISVILARIAALLRSGRPMHSVNPATASLLGAKKILAVDNSATFLNEVCAHLREEGYDLIAARSGKEAMELLGMQAVDCILLDLHMPGLSGHETCRIIKNSPSLRSIPVLMLTADEKPEDAVEGLNSGADDCVGKSADFALLKSRVRVQLRRKQFEDQDRSIREQLLHKELLAVQARAAQEVAEARAAVVDGLEQKNRELEAFAYAVSHDLRSPLRTIRGFSQCLLDDYGEQLPLGARDHVDRVQRAASRMSKLIDALLELSRSSRAELLREPLDLSALARTIAEELNEADGGRQVGYTVQDDLRVNADASLVRVVLNNLLGNSWKYTSRTAIARVEVGAIERNAQKVFFVRDNGVGFDSTRAKRLFQPFERMHAAADFPGAGVGLATVRRIIERHRGEIWAESAVGQGASFFFTLEAPAPSDATPATALTALNDLNA